MAVTKYKIINDALFIRPFIKDNMTELGILVHASVIKKLKKVSLKFSIDDEWKISKYPLQIGSKCYEMFLVIITLESPNTFFFIHGAIHNAQFSFPWEENPTLFIDVGSFNTMEKFIQVHNLQAYISNIEEKPGITSNDEIIKVVTFNKSATKLNIIQKYENNSYTVRQNQPKYYYVTHAFPWLLPCLRRHFKIPILKKCYSVFPIILNHLGQLNYINDLNIFDLLMVRMALCDYRKPLPSNLIKYEIDFMIKRKLVKLVQNNHIDLDRYLIAINYEHKDLQIGYLVYEFQHLFEIVSTRYLHKSSGLNSHKLHTVIKLVQESDAVDTIKQKYNVNFDIDGSGYDQMNLSLFLNLVECRNVNKITLDTNHKWFKDECSPNKTISNLDQIIEVELVGANVYNFIEEFISSLKTVPFRKTRVGGIKLQINGNVNDYTIFDNLTVAAVLLNGIKIDGHMLVGLHKCELKSKFSILNCTFEYTRQNWALLNSLEELTDVSIIEDEGIWQSLFEFILDEMLKTNSNEFRFDHSRYQIINGHRNILLEYFQFTIDELSSKLEIRSKRNNQIIDLFELKFRLKPNDKSEYDFYQ